MSLIVANWYSNYVVWYSDNLHLCRRKSQVTGVTPVDRSQQQKWAKYALELWDEDKLGHIWKVAVPFDYASDFVYNQALGGFAGFHGEEDLEEQTEEEDELYLVHTVDPDEDQPPTPSSPDIPTPAAASVESEDGLLLSTVMSPDASISEAPSQQLEPQQLPEPSKMHVFSMPVWHELEILLYTGIPQPEVTLTTIAEDMMVEDVLRFLEEIKLGEYRELFEEEQVDGKLLHTLSEGMLEEMGVTNGYHRRKIVSKFEGYLQKRLPRK